MAAAASRKVPSPVSAKPRTAASVSLAGWASQRSSSAASAAGGGGTERSDDPGSPWWAWVCSNAAAAAAMVRSSSRSASNRNAIGPVTAALPAVSLWLIVAGGVTYVAGVAFYIWHGLRFQTAIWHLFVAVAAGLHFAAIAVSVA